MDSLQSRFESCWFCSTCNLLNDAQLARALAGQCDGGSGKWTREASSAGGFDQIGAIFPPNFVTSVLKVIKRKMLDQRVISAVELESGGPTAELPEIWNQPDYQEYWDGVNGGFLDPRLVHLDQKGTSVRLPFQDSEEQDLRARVQEGPECGGIPGT